MYTNTERFLRLLRHHIKPYLLSSRIKSAHIAEALAHGLDFGSAIALHGWATEIKPNLVWHSNQRFTQHLSYLGYNVDGVEEILHYQLPSIVFSILREKRYLEWATAHELALIFGLLLDTDDISESENSWKEQANKLLTAVFDILICKREGGEKISLDQVFDALSLNFIIEYRQKNTSSNALEQSIDRYLSLVPSYDSSLPARAQSQIAFDSHGYLEMQFEKSRVLAYEANIWLK